MLSCKSPVEVPAVFRGGDARGERGAAAPPRLIE